MPYAGKRLCALLSALLLWMLPVFVKGTPSQWYCTRAKEGKQALCAPELRFVEEHGGYYIDHTHGDDNGEKVVYLTFDAGYENGNVAKTLDALKEAEVTAAFFVLKHTVLDHGELVRRMEREGHLVCNHTATHPDLSGAVAEQIEKELRALEGYCREAEVTLSPYFRPPEGRFSSEMLETVSALGYKTVFWSFAYDDWDNSRQKPPEKALQIIRDNIHNGAVLLLHPTSATNAAILPQLIKELKEEGYRFGTLRELCGD